MTAGLDAGTAPLVFEAEAIAWRGPAPFVFAAVPAALVPAVRAAARVVSYGWGVVPVAATANGIAFTTSLFPREGGYLVPLKAMVRRQGNIAVGDTVRLALTVTAADRRRLGCA